MDEAQKAANRAAAAIPQLLEIGQGEFKRQWLVPLPTLADFLAQRTECRRVFMGQSEDPLKVANDRITAAERGGMPLSPTTVEAMVNSALKSAASKEGKVEPSDDQLKAVAQSDEIMVWWAFQLIRKVDKEITLPQVRALIGPDVAEVSQRVGDILSQGLKNLNPN